MVKLEGTKVSEKDFKTLPGVIYYKPYTRYKFTAGYAVSVFLEGLKQGKIIGSICRRCGRVYVPPRSYCEYCLKPTDEFIELPDRGEISTVVISYISAKRGRLEKPEFVGVIRLETPGYREGSYEFAGLFHKICGITEEDVKTGRAIGMKVKARWKPSEERTGSILDIECFEPIGGGEQ